MRFLSIAFLSLFLSFTSWAQARDSIMALDVKLEGITNGKPIPGKFASCAPDGKGRARDSDNISPAITWSQGPAGTKSYALIVVDKDVPVHFDLANQQDKSIPADFPRHNFYHWVLVDIPPTVDHLPENAGADDKQYGLSGTNDLATKKGVGTGHGYVGPCPPWNDLRTHQYHFQVYAVDIPSLGLEGAFGGGKVEKHLQGHVLAKGEVIGTYTTNQKITEGASHEKR